MFIAIFKTFFGQQVNGSDITQPPITPPFAQRMAPSCRPFHELPLFRDTRSTSDPTEVSKVIPLAPGLDTAPACEWSHHDVLATLVETDGHKTLTTPETDTEPSKPVSRAYVTMVGMDIDYVQAIFERMSVEMDEMEVDVKRESLQTYRVYDFNDSGEIILPTKWTTISLPPRQAISSSFSSASGTPSLDTLPSSSPLLPPSPVGPNTPSPPTYASRPLFSAAPFKPTSSASLLRITHYPDDVVPTSSGSPINTRLDYDRSDSLSTSNSIASSPSASVSGCGVIEEPHQRHFPASSSHTFGSPGDFDETSSPIHFSSPAVVAGRMSPRCNAGSSQTFGEPGYQGSFVDAVLADSPQPPSTSAFGCAVNSFESQSSISSSSRSPVAGAELHTLGVEDFHIKKLLGSGAFGDVYLTTCRRDGTLHAMKVIEKKKTSHPQARVFLLNEQKILRRLADAESPFAVNLETSFSDSRNYYFVMNFLPGGDLEDLIHSRNEPFDMATLKSYTTDLVQGLTFLRKNRIIHRDIKPANVFIDAHGHLVLGDYGLARIFEAGDPMFEHPTSALMNDDDWGALSYCEVNDMTDSTCGSLGYMAPEIIVGDPYSALVDIWSLGATFYELAFGMIPFPGENRDELVVATLYMDLKFPGTDSRWPIDAGLKDLIQNMLVKEQRDRIRLQAVVNHPYFEGVEWHVVASRARQPDVKSDDDDDGEATINTGNAFTCKNRTPEPDFDFICPKWQEEAVVQPTPTSEGEEDSSDTRRSVSCYDLQAFSHETWHEGVYSTGRCENLATASLPSYANGGPGSEAEITELKATRLYPSRPSNPLHRTSTVATLSFRPPSLTRNAPDSNGKIHQPEDSDLLDLGHVSSSGTDCWTHFASASHRLVRSAPQLERVHEELPLVFKSFSAVGSDSNGAQNVRFVRSSGLDQQVSFKPISFQRFVSDVFLGELRCYVPAEDMWDEASGVSEPAAPIPLVDSRISISLKGCSSAAPCVLHEERNVSNPGVVVSGSRRGSSLFFVGDDDFAAQSSTMNVHSTGTLAHISPSTPPEKRDLSHFAENRPLVDTTDIEDESSGLLDARSPCTKADTELEGSSWADSSYTRCGSSSPTTSTNHAAELEDNPQKLVVDASSTSNSVSSTGQRKSRRTLAKVLKTGIQATKNVFKGVARIRLRRS